MENYDDVDSYGLISLVLLMQERSEAESRAITSHAAGFNEGRTGGA